MFQIWWSRDPNLPNTNQVSGEFDWCILCCLTSLIFCFQINFKINWRWITLMWYTAPIIISTVDLQRIRWIEKKCILYDVWMISLFNLHSYISCFLDCITRIFIQTNVVSALVHTPPWSTCQPLAPFYPRYLNLGDWWETSSRVSDLLLTMQAKLSLWCAGTGLSVTRSHPPHTPKEPPERPEEHSHKPFSGPQPDDHSRSSQYV